MKKTITLAVNDGTTMNAYVSMPEGTGPFPAVMVFQEAWGVNSHIRDVTDRIAAEGYLAVAPQLFHRTGGADFELPYGDFSLVMPHFQAMTTEGIISDCTATYEWLTQQEDVVKQKIGAIGFCLGGRVSFIANSALPLAAGISYYGGSTHLVAGCAATISGPHLFFWGGKDTHILPEHVDTVIGAMKQHDKEYISVVISYANHAFFCNDRPAYHPQAAAESWGMTKEFLKNKLK